MTDEKSKQPIINYNFAMCISINVIFKLSLKFFNDEITKLQK